MTSKSENEIRTWLIGQIAETIHMPVDQIDPAATFDSYGLASSDAVGLSGDLEDWLERRLSATILYQYTTIDALARHLAAPTVATAPASGVGPTDDTGPQAATSETAETETLSDEDAVAALLAKLTELD